MKKLIVVCFAVCMLVAMMVGCNTQGTNNSTQIGGQSNLSSNPKDNTEVATGTILDAPEVQFDNNAEELYVYFTYPGDTADETLSMELAVEQVSEDMYLLYVTDGLLKNHEIVYEISDTKIVKYYKDIFMENFILETEASQQDLSKEKDSTLSLLSYFTMQHSDYKGIQYKKSDALAITLTGKTYTYDMLEKNECVGQLSVDTSTGLMVNLKDAQGNTLYTVQKYQLSNVEIPEYK